MSQRSPFRYFKTSPDIIHLAVMLYIRFPLSLPNVEDLLHERGIEISHETVRYWWNRFGPMFAAELRRNSHLTFRRRERAMLRFRRMRTLQKFASVHTSVHNHFPTERHLQNRDTYKQTRAAALAEWRGLLTA